MQINHFMCSTCKIIRWFCFIMEKQSIILWLNWKLTAGLCRTHYWHYWQTGTYWIIHWMAKNKDRVLNRILPPITKRKKNRHWKISIYRFPHLKNVCALICCVFVYNGIVHKSGAFSPRRFSVSWIECDCYGLDFVVACKNDLQPKPRPDWNGMNNGLCVHDGRWPTAQLCPKWNKDRKLLLHVLIFSVNCFFFLFAFHSRKKNTRKLHRWNISYAFF